MAVSGSLYPDHVVFLGPHAPPRLPAASFASRAPFVLIDGTGVLLRADLGPAAEEMVRCLAHLLLRLPHEARLAVLSAENEADLMGWDAEEYRRRFDRRVAVD
jgi:rhamnose utilization protein RhaD (predicted bifunctional aldolase and dehydrogenase)